ncbi:MAG TPA: ABC transporter ATP-binding protein [Candidatus Acidoferrales bacterium]|nr:ABC transporter ATP-binding protein [Candidatus Acidoferrales bacterium]
MIRTQGLTKKYARNQALAGLTLEVPEGSVFALVGPNGAGKSTAIKLLMNILQPTAGRAEVLGVDSRKLGARQLAQIGYVSENQQLPEWMRVGYFLTYCKKFYPGWRDDDLAALVASYQLPLDRPLKALSRGMKIKAALAASLAYRPRLIVLDEPFGGLDVLVREQLIESILDRTPEATVLLCSHDLAELESFATHVAYLNEGRLDFVEEMGALSGRFREIEVTLENPTALPPGLPATWLNAEQSGVVIRFTDSGYQAGPSAAEIQRCFPGVREIAARPITLRAIFVALAKRARENP